MNEDASILPVSCSLSLRHLFPPPPCLALSLSPPAPTPPPLSLVAFLILCVTFNFTLLLSLVHSLPCSLSCFLPLSLSLSRVRSFAVFRSLVCSLSLSHSLFSLTQAHRLHPPSHLIPSISFLLHSIAYLCKVTHCAQPSGPISTAQDLTLPQTTEL